MFKKSTLYAYVLLNIISIGVLIDTQINAQVNAQAGISPQIQKSTDYDEDFETSHKYIDLNNKDFTNLELMDIEETANPYPVYGNLFSEAIPKEDLDYWNDYIKAVKRFVAKRSFGSSSINKAIDSVVDLSISIENSIKIARNTHAIDKKTEQQKDTLKKILEKLNKDRIETQKKVQAINSETFFLHRKERKEAIYVISDLFATLNNIVDLVIERARTYTPAK